MQHLFFLISFLKTSENLEDNSVNPEITSGITRLGPTFSNLVPERTRIIRFTGFENDMNLETNSENSSNGKNESENNIPINDFIRSLFFSERLLNSESVDNLGENKIKELLQIYKNVLLEDNNGQTISFKEIAEIADEDLFDTADATVRKKIKKEFNDFINKCNELQSKLLDSSKNIIEKIAHFLNEIDAETSKQGIYKRFTDFAKIQKKYVDDKKKYIFFATQCDNYNRSFNMKNGEIVREAFSIIDQNLKNNKKFLVLLNEKLQTLYDIHDKLSKNRIMEFARDLE